MKGIRGKELDEDGHLLIEEEAYSHSAEGKEMANLIKKIEVLESHIQRKATQSQLKGAAQEVADQISELHEQLGKMKYKRKKHLVTALDQTGNKLKQVAAQASSAYKTTVNKLLKQHNDLHEDIK